MLENQNVTRIHLIAKNNVLLLVKFFLKKALYNAVSQIAGQQGPNY